MILEILAGVVGATFPKSQLDDIDWWPKIEVAASRKPWAGKWSQNAKSCPTDFMEIGETIVGFSEKEFYCALLKVKMLRRTRFQFELRCHGEEGEGKTYATWIVSIRASEFEFLKQEGVSFTPTKFVRCR